MFHFAHSRGVNSNFIVAEPLKKQHFASRTANIIKKVKKTTNIMSDFRRGFFRRREV